MPGVAGCGPGTRGRRGACLLVLATPVWLAVREKSKRPTPCLLSLLFNTSFFVFFVGGPPF